MTWNHRIIRHNKPGVDIWFGVHEVFYNEKNEPRSCTLNPITIVGETVEELKETIDWITKALSKPVIDIGYFEGLVPDPLEFEEDEVEE